MELKKGVGDGGGCWDGRVIVGVSGWRDGGLGGVKVEERLLLYV